MKFLKALFEASLHCEFNEEGNIIFENSGVQFAPLTVLSSDQTAYDAEYAGWLNDVWLERNRQRLNSILAIHGNKGRFTDLMQSVLAKRVVPVVGSGMSQAAGLPLWREFLQGLSKYSGVADKEIDNLLVSGKFEEAVDVQAAGMGQRLFQERVEHDLRVEDANDIKGAVLLLPELFPKFVVTTNLDNVLDLTYRLSEHSFQHILAGDDVAKCRQLYARGESVLLKLHGDSTRSEGRVLGVSEYDQAYATGGLCRNALGQTLSNHPLLWLGCSLSMDRTMDLAADIARRDNGAPKHYAFLQLPDTDAVRIGRERELSERQIYPIWYEGDHDESIEALLVRMLEKQGKFESGD